MKEKKERRGWTWQEVGNNGYWVKDDVDSAHKHKIPFFCPNCQKICGTIDDQCLLELGICRECKVMYIEDRITPLIDLSKFKK